MRLLWTLLALFTASCLAWVPQRTIVRSWTLHESAKVENNNDSVEHKTPTTFSRDDNLDYTIPDDAVVIIRPQAMARMRELKQQQQKDMLLLRMGVRSGGCSGMSYVMDFTDTIEEEDVVDDYGEVKCIVDPKSLLYLYGLELDYSTELVGGGFQFHNPNAEESCGCGSSFGV